MMKNVAAKILRLLIMSPFVIPMSVKLARSISDLLWERGEEHSLVQFVLVGVLFVAVAIAAQQLIHLVGRLICGELAGYRVAEINVFNLQWKITDGHARFNFRRGLLKQCTCVLLMPEDEPEKPAMVLATIGSVAFDFLVGTALLVISSELNHFSLFSAVLYIIALYSFIDVVCRGVPIRFLYGENNGYYLLELLRHPKAPHNMWISSRIAEMHKNNVLFTDMPAEWFPVPTAAEMKNMYLAHIGALACSRMVDEHRYAEADRLAEALLKEGNLRAVNRCFLMMYRIRCELMGENRPEVVEGLVTRELKKWMEKAAKQNPDIHATLYALALLHEKDGEKAKRIAAEIEQQVKTTEYSVNAVEAKDFMAQVNRLAG